MKISKTRLKEIIKEELASLKEVGDEADALKAAMETSPAVVKVLTILQRKAKNKQLVANTLAKIHQMIRPGEKIADLFSMSKAAGEELGAPGAEGELEQAPTAGHEEDLAENRKRRRRK